jgi:hypothetical protein
MVNTGPTIVIGLLQINILQAPTSRISGFINSSLPSLVCFNGLKMFISPFSFGLPYVRSLFHIHSQHKVPFEPATPLPLPSQYSHLYHVRASLLPTSLPETHPLLRGVLSLTGLGPGASTRTTQHYVRQAPREQAASLGYAIAQQPRTPHPHPHAHTRTYKHATHIRAVLFIIFCLIFSQKSKQSSSWKNSSFFPHTLAHNRTPRTSVHTYTRHTRLSPHAPRCPTDPTGGHRFHSNIRFFPPGSRLSFRNCPLRLRIVCHSPRACLRLGLRDYIRLEYITSLHDVHHHPGSKNPEMGGRLARELR